MHIGAMKMMRKTVIFDTVPRFNRHGLMLGHISWQRTLSKTDGMKPYAD